ncbi:hypothetical protein NM208_g1750 [Fusarium decemcellulare]|uniref:Uncharacterized protein n=1 Tax=Fusarium decemcellulare TaxID=57161 RepID=A0ACC1SV23_9HYPO|nr:hypothetical protein NM208_g1750 [Fusarium decemcellulare]
MLDPTGLVPVGPGQQVAGVFQVLLPQLQLFGQLFGPYTAQAIQTRAAATAEMTSTTAEPRLACLLCRQRKVACDRQRPRCGLCSKNGFDCQYKPRQQRPGLRAGYVSRLERQLCDVQERLKRVEVHLEQSRPIPFLTSGSTSASLSDESGHFAPVDSPAVSGETEQNHSPTHGAEVACPNTPMEWQTPATSDELLFAVANRSLKFWFQIYHPWFPIIHECSLHEVSSSTSPRYELVWKALTAVVILHQVNAPFWERNIAEQLREQVMQRGLNNSSLQSIQALLILSNYYYTLGCMTQFWNILATCKKMWLHPCLHEFAAIMSWSCTSRIRVTNRCGPISIVEKEEAVRAFWMIDMLDSMSTMGLPNYSPFLKNPPTAILPCLDSIWALREPIIEHSASSSREYSSVFSLCIILTTEELGAVRQFLEKPSELTRLDQRLEWQSEAQRLDERLTNWREEFVAAVFRLINAEKEQLPRGEMEPFITLTNCILNSAIIVLFQQMAPFPKDIERDFEPWAFATTRCVYACENLAAKVRRIGVDQLASQSCHLIMPIFEAARFYVAYSKALDADVPANLHTLAFTLHTFGKRWPLAHQYETIIRAAVAEHRSPISQCVVPVEFYDFRYPTLCITHLLQEAAERLNRPETSPK